jgi:hypothetical protein
VAFSFCIVIFKMRSYRSLRAALLALSLAGVTHAGTVAQWLFDEQKEAYPSSLLTDSGSNNYFVVLGRGAHLVDGRFGHALEPADPLPLHIAGHAAAPGAPSATTFGLVSIPTPAGRTVPPMTWMNATFAALMTSGEKQLRTPGFANASDTKLNLGAFDWTVEFWYAGRRAGTEGVVFEIGAGPRGENDHVTRLTLSASGAEFVLFNQPSGVSLRIPSAAAMLAPGAGWHHLAFVYEVSTRQLRHYVDGKLQPLPGKAALQALPHGDEAYFTIGRDEKWARPLAGAIDELRFSDSQVYTAAFEPPASFAARYSGRVPTAKLKAGPPLLLGAGRAAGPLDLGSRKFLFLEDGLIESSSGVRFVPHLPKRAEKVIPQLRGHMSVVQDDQGLIRIYYAGPEDSLAVMTSRDGIHWQEPDLGHGEYKGKRNIVLREAVGLGNVFIDPNAPPESRFRYVSGIKRQSIFVFTSRDGFDFQRFDTPVLPFASGSQSVVYYDDQRQLYVGHHRSDYGATVGGHTRRRYVRSEVNDLFSPWPFTHVTDEMTRQVNAKEKMQVGTLDPWYLDNGPLTPPGFGIDLPTAFATDEKFDPPGTDVYVTSVSKYEWAPDAYLAFPSIYFHYREEGPETREVLGSEERKRGSGVVEVQLATSRDGLSWKRYPRPAYAGIDDGGTNTEHEMFMVQGLVRRGNEIWQYVTGHPGNGMNYHSSIVKNPYSPVYRLVQRLDGFVAAEADYQGGTFTTKPLKFQGNRLYLNLNTGAAGYAQVGIVEADGKPIPGFSVDDCIYINGDFLHTAVEWKRGTDVGSLEGRTVRLVFRMSGTQLYAMQFTGE